MSKAHSERRAVATISVEAVRLASVSCPHPEEPCDNCLRQCQREIEDSLARASARVSSPYESCVIDAAGNCTRWTHDHLLTWWCPLHACFVSYCDCGCASALPPKGHGRPR